MQIENKIHEKLLSHPALKRIIKRIYQRLNVIIKNPKSEKGNIVCVSPQDDYDYFFGYYDKSPWDADNRFMLCMKAKDTSKCVCPKDSIDILLINTKNNNKVKKIASSHAWNVQQGCMAQWIGPDFKSKIIYNDFRNNKYCSIIIDIVSKKETVIDMPIYSLSSDGRFAFTLDFSRLHRLRPGYGYSNIPDTTSKEKIPNSPCVWYIDLVKNEITPYLDYMDFYNFETREEMEKAEHKINHIMISPKNDKFMVIHRWYIGNKKYSRLITCNIKTKKMFNLSDDNMVSHCFWKNNNEILGFLNKKETGNGYYLMKDNCHDYKQMWNYLVSDGHPSYAPDGKLVVTDSYPNKNRVQSIKILSDNEVYDLCNIYAPFKYDNDTRCDLHPRWSRDGKNICFDGCFDGKRRLYILKVDIVNNNEKQEYPIGKYKIVYLMTSCKKTGPTNQTLNIIKNLDRTIFEPYLITINPEQKDSQLYKFLPYVKHYSQLTSKKNILLKKTKKLDDLFDSIKPDLVHTVGLFPNCYASNRSSLKQITTLRNYVYEDYPAKFGRIRGLVMAKLQLNAVKKTEKVIACSKSLHDIYLRKLKLNFDYIQNGVDITKFSINRKNKKICNKLKIEDDSFIFIYTGQFIARKNLDYLLEGFKTTFNNNKKVSLVLVGDGPELDRLKTNYKSCDNIVFVGSVNNVEDYLSIGDVYVSSSKSEGLPNGVLEAMACGLPVLLSDIPQHMEILEDSLKVGFAFSNNNIDDLKEKLLLMANNTSINVLKKNSVFLANNVFSDKVMSKKYQDVYISTINKY